MIINLNPACYVETKPGAEEIKTMQKETMEMMVEYMDNLIPKMEDMVTELRTEVLDDTFEFLRMMIDGFNWVINAYNGCCDVINEDGKLFANEEIDLSVDAFGRAFRNENAEATANVMEKEIIPFLKQLKEAIIKVLA